MYIPHERNSMKKRDRKNLAFLMAQTPESLREWYGQADEEDRAYAEELLAIASQQMQRPTYQQQHQQHSTLQ